MVFIDNLAKKLDYIKYIVSPYLSVPPKSDGFVTSVLESSMGNLLYKDNSLWDRLPKHLECHSFGNIRK